ncbi:SCO7613 C-terminal domain-containing membrane protein [Nonomuraea sp. SYSU D8015]|uniref:SCO7613 C-terminal domain-containing membrane protein n=1 Tax=Nonomuraea sp. SYSU D8015 TaxID=2593644 RepID=UPI001661645A|nr:hypothetical protein [Nonomuraea sp. SYSU D8015]
MDYWPTCPGCGATLTGPPSAACPECSLLLHGPAAADYLAAAAALAKLEERRTDLLKRRDEALAAMRAATTAASTRADPVPTADRPMELAGATATQHATATGHATATQDATATGHADAGRRADDQKRADADGRLDRGEPVDVGGRPDDAGGRPRRDLSHRAVQNLLLLLGGVLLSIAAVVFTLVSWQVPALRALILSVFTLGVLAAPWLLARRRLIATAETVALVGLVLLPLDGVAIMQVFDDGGPSTGPGLNPLWGYALGGAALTVGWAVYSRWAPLRLPAPVAIVLAQAPLPLAGLAVMGDPSAGFGWPAGALIATAAFDLVLWQAARRAQAAVEYVTTAVAGSLAWLLGVGLVAFQEWHRTGDGTSSPMPPPVAALVLAAASVVAVLWAAATRDRAARRFIATLASLAAVGAVSIVPVSMAALSWAGASWMAAIVAAGACLILAAAFTLPVRLRDGVRTGALLALLASAVWKGYAVITALVAPLGWLRSIWSEVGGPAVALLGPPDVQWDDTAATPLVMAAVALGWALVPPMGEVWTAGFRRTICLVSSSLAVLTAPLGTGLPYEAALAVLVALAGALFLMAARQHATPRRPALALVPGGPPPGTPQGPEAAAGSAAFEAAPRGGADVLTRQGWVALWVGGYVAGLAMCWALADRQATVGVAGGLLVILLVCAVAARPATMQAVGGAGATLAAGVLVWGLFADGLVAAFALLGLRAATLVVTRPSRRLARAVVRARSTAATLALGSLDRLTRTIRPGGRAAVEAASVVVGLFALGQQGVHGEWTALVLAVGAVLAAASAWRRPRGPWRTAAVVEACVLAALAPLPVSSAVVPALVGPYAWVTHAWAGAAEGAREMLSPSGPWQEQPMLLPVLVLAGAAGMFAAWARWGRAAAMGVARIAFPLAATTLPVVADLPYWAALAFLVALTAGLALWSAVSRSAAGSASLWTATLAVSWSLADRTATLAVLAAIVVTGVLCAIRGKGSPVTSVASTVTGLAVGAESVAAALGGGLGQENAALVLLLVAVLLSRAAALPVLPGAVAGPVGGTALASWVVAMVLTGDDPARLSLVLAVGSLALAGAAGRLRAQRRSGAYVLAAVVSGAAVLPHLTVWGTVLGLPYLWATEPWRERFGGWSPRPEADEWAGAQGEVFRLAPSGFELSGVETALGVAVFVAVTGVIVARGLRGAAAGRSAATVGAFGCLVLVPAVAEMPYAGMLVFYGVMLVALAAQAALGPRPGVAGVLAVGLAVHLVVLSLDVDTYTLVVSGGVALLGVAAAVLARDETSRTGAAASATVATGALAIASALSAGFPTTEAAFAALAVAALSAAAAAVLARHAASPSAALAPIGAPVAGARRPAEAHAPSAHRLTEATDPARPSTERTQAGTEHELTAPDQPDAGNTPNVPGTGHGQARTTPVQPGADHGRGSSAPGQAEGTPSQAASPVGEARAAGGVATVAGRARGGAVALGVEVPGWWLAAVALIMTASDGGLLSLALACTGALALAVALRPDRRPVAWGGAALLQLALWLQLAISEVTAPEAYTAPLTLAGLVAAWRARRRDPGISSWTGYGAALALTFLPSAYVAWNDVALSRPLLLGAAAFAATLAGAWARLQAPLILGGAVLVVTAAHEFAPTLAELVGEGPRWLPIALAGAFLLFTGATYEHRMRDLRKIRRFIIKMR